MGGGGHSEEVGVGDGQRGGRERGGGGGEGSEVAREVTTV